MLTSTGPAGSRACVLLLALDEHEITVREFAKEVEPMSAEEAQVLATVLRCHAENALQPRQEFWTARLACLKAAAAGRVWS